jgi:hypothetical protein
MALGTIAGRTKRPGWEVAFQFTLPTRQLRGRHIFNRRRKPQFYVGRAMATIANAVQTNMPIMSARLEISERMTDPLNNAQLAVDYDGGRG